MTVLRVLPICLSPGEGEAFASWVDRAAADLALPLSTLLVAMGLAEERPGEVISMPRAYGVTLTASELAAVCATTGCPPERIASTLLAHYGGRVFDLADVDLATGRGFSHLAVRHWVYASGSSFCSDCLVESGGVWRLAWKLPWSFACTRHARLLGGLCPACGQRPRDKRRTKLGPQLPASVPTPTSCSTSLRQSPVRDGRTFARCGFQLGGIELPSLANFQRLLSSQTEIDAVMAGRQPTVAGLPVSPLAFFGDLRALVYLMLQVGRVEVSPPVEY